MLRRCVSALTAALFCAQTVLSSALAGAQTAPQTNTDFSGGANFVPANETTAVLDAANRRVSLAGLTVFLRDGYQASSAVLVRARCASRSETPSLAIDAATHGARA